MDPEEAAGLARALAPKLAVPMHYGFVVGSPSDADGSAIRRARAVEFMTPQNPFELE